jgi:hypothetical protein
MDFKQYSFWLIRTGYKLAKLLNLLFLDYLSFLVWIIEFGFDVNKLSAEIQSYGKVMISFW